MPVIPFGSWTPEIGERVFVAPNAWITGNVKVENDASFFFGAAARGDLEPIKVGARSNIQEQAVLHTSKGKTPCIVGDDVTVGHSAILHSCTVAGRSIIGMGSIVLDGAHIEEYCIIGAHALVTMGTRIPARSLVVGAPAIVKRQLTDAEIHEIEDAARRYIEVAKTYREYFESIAF